MTSFKVTRCDLDDTLLVNVSTASARQMRDDPIEWIRFHVNFLGFELNILTQHPLGLRGPSFDRQNPAVEPTLGLLQARNFLLELFQVFGARRLPEFSLQLSKIAGDILSAHNLSVEGLLSLRNAALAPAGDLVQATLD